MLDKTQIYANDEDIPSDDLSFFITKQPKYGSFYRQVSDLKLQLTFMLRFKNLLTSLIDF